jgi:hypothetical protein
MLKLSIIVNGEFPPVIVCDYGKVATSMELAKSLQIETESLVSNYLDNFKLFIEGEHFISTTKEALSEIGMEYSTGEPIILWTLRGCLLHSGISNVDMIQLQNFIEFCTNYFYTAIW